MAPHLPRIAALLLFLAPLASPAAAAPDLAGLDSVPRVALPRVILEKALAEAPRKDRPFQYAVGVPLDVRTPHGKWETLADGSLRWRLKIESVGARSLSLHFAPFALPPSARVWIYAEDGALVHGPYNQANATPEGLWTPIIPQERLVIEAQVAAAEAARLNLAVAHAYHGYRDWKDSTVAKSGSCNIDVACPVDGVWDDEVRAVARISIGGTVLCTGQLLNNAEQDLDPLFLTANHCEIGTMGKPASSVVVYWNFQASTCGGPRDDPDSQTQSGSTLLASDSASDFALVRLDQTPSVAFGVYYAGWNADVTAGTGTDCGVSIHHPEGHEKAISFFTTPLTRVNSNIGGFTVRAWEVDHWTFGTTEAGSSGGGLWNRNHELIGVLSGGDASCSNRNGSDYYGRLEEAWDAKPASNAQLKAHLDPVDRGRTRMPGLDPTDDTPPGPDDITSMDCGTTPMAPVAKSDSYMVSPGLLLTVEAPGVLANDTDPNGDPIIAALQSTTSSGTLELADDGGFSYTPNEGFIGVDSFTYRSQDDGGLESSTVTVTIRVENRLGAPSGGGALSPWLLCLIGVGSGFSAHRRPRKS